MDRAKAWRKPVPWICTKPHAEAQEEAKNRCEEQKRTKKQEARRRARARKNQKHKQEDEQEDEQEQEARSIFRIRTPSPGAQDTHPPGVFLTVDDMVADLREQWKPVTFTLMQWKEHIAQKHSYHAATEEYKRIKAMMMELRDMGFVWEAAEQDKQRHKLHKLCNKKIDNSVTAAKQSRATGSRGVIEEPLPAGFVQKMHISQNHNATMRQSGSINELTR